MKFVIHAVTLLSFVQAASSIASVTPALAADSNNDILIAREKARIAHATFVLENRKAELLELQGQIQEIREALDKAKHSQALNAAIFFPATVVTFIGFGMLLKGITARAWSGSKILGLYFGGPLTAVGTAAAGISGVKIVIRSGDIDRFNAKLDGLEKRLQGEQATVFDAEQKLGDATSRICLLEHPNPADCEPHFGDGSR